MTLHVIGNICVDVAMRVTALPGPGETVNAADSLRGPGGKGANQALAASRAGAAVRFFSAVGQDGEGAGLLDRVAAAGLPVIDIARVRAVTDMSVVLVADSAENIVASCVACARAIGDETVAAVAEALSPGDAMLLQGNLNNAVTQALAAQARKAGIRLAVNASPLDGSAFPSCDLLVVNRGEAESLSGNGDIDAAIDTLHALGARDVVVTLGAEGATGLCGGARFWRPAKPVKAVDTSGAGDVFCGVVVALWHAGMALPEAVERAAGAAALAVTRPGTFDSCPTRDEMQAIMLRKD